MHGRYPLTQAQRDRLDRETQDVLNSLADVGTAQGAYELCGRLRDAAEGGDREAERILEDWQYDGAAKQIRRIVKRDRTVVRFASGRKMTVPTRVGVRAVNQRGEKERWFQQSLWYELSWPRFQGMIASLESQRDQMSSEITAYSRVLVYRAQFPESRTPLEACERAGVDVRQIGFEDDERAA